MIEIVVTQPTQHIVLDRAGQYRVVLSKSGTHVNIFGAFEAIAGEQCAVELWIVHAAAHTTAQTVLKGVGHAQSQLRFFGKIVVQPNCHHVQSFLEERVLLLDSTARAEAIPELEILNDDVKCSHAASITQIPHEHLFYLQSRGITYAAAQQLIVEGFLRIKENNAAREQCC
jgi:Fe-S cluster assembly protein SufD